MRDPTDLKRARTWAWTLLLASGFLAAGAPAAVAGEPTNGDPPAMHAFQDRYFGGGAVEALSTVAGLGLPSIVAGPDGAGVDSRGCVVVQGNDLCPMFGVALCDLNEQVGTDSFRDGLGLQTTDARPTADVSPVGGSCPGSTQSPIVVRPGDHVVVDARDDAGQAVTFGVCIDGDDDGLCRPENFEATTDVWTMRSCSEPGPVDVLHQGNIGVIYVFVFNQVGPTTCVPTAGTIWGHVDTATSRLPECADGRDNDGDGGVDSTDLGCVSAGDGDERGEEPSAPAVSARCLPFSVRRDSSYAEHLVVGTCARNLDADCGPGVAGCIQGADPSVPECSDGANNDPHTDGSPDDGTDYPFDPDCDGPLDDRERGPACSDHIENDGDGFTDGADPGCTGPTDDDEFNVWACSDGLDNDGDTRKDYPNDPGCTGPYDNSEANTWACSDGADNDGDGRRDYPSDPGCRAWYDDSEWNPRPKSKN